MAKPTGKLKFAYETISNMESKIKDLQQEMAILKNSANFMRYVIHEQGLSGWQPEARERMEKILYDDNDKLIIE